MGGCAATLPAMHMRGVVAVAAGVAGAALAHALDEAGLLPGVHEAANVRGGMSVSVTVIWLGLAATLSWVASKRGLVRLGAPASLLIAAIPELVGRHDIGAIVEPGAIAGALVQWLLLVAVAAVVVMAGRGTLVVLAPSFGAVAWPAPPVSLAPARGHVVDHRGRPRAPPGSSLISPFI